jgi:hypothetical protein
MLSNITKIEFDFKEWDLLNFDYESFQKKRNRGGTPRYQASDGRESGLSFVINMEDEKMSCPQYESEGARVR